MFYFLLSFIDFNQSDWFNDQFVSQVHPAPLGFWLAMSSFINLQTLKEKTGSSCDDVTVMLWLR